MAEIRFKYCSSQLPGWWAGYTRSKLTEELLRTEWAVSGLVREIDTSAVLYLVRQYAGWCTDAARVDLVVFVAVLLVVAVSMGLPWVTQALGNGGKPIGG